MANGETTLNTGGGASVGNNVQTGGGAFVGRDQINFIVPLGDWEEVREMLFKDGARASATKATPEQFQSFDWAKAEQAYLGKVIKLYDRVRILGSSSDVPLGNLFTQVYILDKPTARYRYDIEELRNQTHDRVNFQRQPGERMHGLDLVKKGQNLFILGKPGAGKTTFLKYITIQAAHKQLPHIPIFVSLNQWADSRWGKGEEAALFPFIVEQFDICNFPDAAIFIDYLLQEGRSLVLFDGLDEVKEEKNQRRRLTRLLQDFANKYDRSQYLITCRIAASDYAFAGFTDVEVADFTPDQVREYTRNWFCEQEKKFDIFTAELARAENKGLAELCNTPLLLSLLCLTFDNAMRFPPNRAELYEDALDTLLRKWDSSRQIQRDEIYRALSHKRKLQLLMNIAMPTFEKSELFFRQRDLEKWIVDYLARLPDAQLADTLDGVTILKAMEAQHSILVERAQGVYSFSHLTFQEYLTARSLAENPNNAVTDTIVRSHLTDPRWREVFLLLASLLADAEQFINTLRQATNDLILTTSSLIELLEWSYERAKQANTSVELCSTVQLTYISLRRARYLPHARDLARAIEHYLVLEHYLTLDLARALEHEIGYARNLVLDLARATTPLVGFDYGLYYAWIYASLFANEKLARTSKVRQLAMQALSSLIESLTTLACEGQQDHLVQYLSNKPVPSPNTTNQDWQLYADALSTILSDERDLKREWVFSDKEIDKLNAYFYANELLVQCLKVAAVTDRQAVLNGLLLPPADLDSERV